GKYNPSDCPTRPPASVMNTNNIAIGVQLAEEQNFKFDARSIDVTSTVATAQKADPTICGLYEKVKKGATLQKPENRGLCIGQSNKLLCRRTLLWTTDQDEQVVDVGGERIVIPESDHQLQDYLVRRYHVHGGIAQNLRRLTAKFVFRGLKGQCKQFNQQCLICDKMRRDAGARKAIGSAPL
ncbi:hypothetical protein Pmar_PMAR026643, partial [Perkinsus marinus ATCC 50983]